MRRALLTLWTLALLAFPSVAADASVETPVLLVVVDDQRDDRCSTPADDVCLYEIQPGNDTVDWEVDVYQRVNYVGVATDLSLLREHVGDLWLLPDPSLVVRGSDLKVPHPVFITLTETWNQAPWPSDEYYLDMSPAGFWLQSNNPAISDPTGPWGRRAYGMPYGEDIGYEQFGPLNTPEGTDSDHFIDVVAFPCAFDLPSCHEKAGIVSGFYKDQAPNLTFGLEFYDLQVATDPANLTPPVPTALAANLTNGTLGARPGAPADAPAEARPAAPARDEDAPSEANRAGRSGEPGPASSGPPLQLQGRPPLPPPPDRTVQVLMAVAAAAGALLALLGLMLYSRFNSRAEALASETRNRLLALARERPGIYLAEAAAALGVAPNAVRHHLRVLERVQLVRVVQDGKVRSIYPVGAEPVRAPAWLRRNETCLAILRIVADRPTGLAREDLMRLLPELPERTRNHHVSRLVGVGALSQTVLPDGRRMLRAAEGWDAAAPAPRASA